MNVLFHPEAMREFIQAVDYYEDISKGLGVDFVKEVYHGIELILQYPKAWSRVSKHSKRYMINRFPYGIIYRHEDTDLYILAIMMLNREPDYWKRRQ